MKNNLLVKLLLICVLSFLLLALWEGCASADIVWPGLVLEERLFSIWSIGLGILVEWPFVFIATKFTWKKSLWVTICINAISAILGILIIPLTNFLMFYMLYPLLQLHNYTQKWLIFNNPFWFLNVAFAAIICTLIEMLALIFIFYNRINKKTFLILLVANILSVGIAWISLIINPYKYHH